MTQNIEYFRERWNLFVALAPPVSLIGMQNFPQLKFLTDDVTTSVIAKVMKGLKVYEVYPSNFLSSMVFKTLCLIAPDICDLAQLMVADSNPELNS
jgi:hypothetical protein